MELKRLEELNTESLVLNMDTVDTVLTVQEFMDLMVDMAQAMPDFIPINE